MRKAMMTAVLVAMTAGAAVPADATTVIFKETFKGSQAFAEFFGSGSLTCANGTTGFVSIFGFLNGAQQVIIQTGTPTTIGNGVSIEVDSFFNTCTNQALSGEGQIVGGFTPPDTKLTSAAMAGTTSIQDFGGGPPVTLSLNVTLTGTGTTSQSKDNSHSKIIGSKEGPLSITQSHFANSNRSATLSGSLTVAGVPIDVQSFFGILVANDNSSMSVSK